MPTIMDFYGSGLTAANNQIKNRYLAPMLEQELTKARTSNKYLDPQLAAELYALQTKNKFLPEHLRLGNEYQGLVNRFYAPEHEATIREKNFFLENPLLKSTGSAGQVGAALFLKKLGGGLQGNPNMTLMDEPSNQGTGGLSSPIPIEPPKNSYGNYADKIIGNMDTLNRVRNSVADVQQLRAENFNWGQLPAETRNNLVAQGLGMGVDPVKMKGYINKGMTIQQIAEKEGLDPNNIPAPVYYPTATTKTRTQQVQQVGAELDFMSSATTPIIKKYADTFLGKSPKLISDMLSNDPERQKEFGRYLGAMAVQSELANGRVLLAGGRSGIEIVRDLRSKSLKGIDGISPVKMSSVAFDEAQKTIDSILQRGAKIRTSTGMSPFSNPNKETPKKDPKDMTLEELEAEDASYG